MTALGSDDIDWNKHWREVQTENVDADISDLKWFIDLLPKNKFTVVELGCGYGRYAKIWKELNGEYFGIDFSEEAIKRARLHNPDITFIQGFNYELGMFGRRFDVVFTNTHLQHVDNVLKNFLFEHIRQNLSQDGLLIANFEKDDANTKTTLLFDKFKSLTESYGFRLLRYAGTNKGSIWRKL